ncbi:MAG: zinc ribbon domain-containing protein [Actinomycetota bacterium]
MTGTVVATFEFEQPYLHSTGDAMSRFLTALRDDGVIWGRRCERCSLVVVPALDHCETCGADLGEWAVVGPSGTVQGFTVAGDRAFARIRLDGADTDLIHRADVRGLSRGARVHPRWTATRTGSINDIEHFTAEEASLPAPHQDGGPVTAVAAHPRMPYTLSAGALQSRFMDGIRRGVIHANRCPSCESVFVPPRASCSACWTECTDWIEVPGAGAVAGYVIVNVTLYGQQVEIPYVLAQIRLDGVTMPFLHLVATDPAAVRTGMRVRAVWRDNRTGFLNEDIDHFEPEDE